MTHLTRDLYPCTLSTNSQHSHSSRLTYWKSNKKTSATVNLHVRQFLFVCESFLVVLSGLETDCIVKQFCFSCFILTKFLLFSVSFTRRELHLCIEILFYSGFCLDFLFPDNKNISSTYFFHLYSQLWELISFLNLKI